MKFFDRESEIDSLRQIEANSKKNASFTVVTGRRRIGKTKLLLSAFNEKQTLYFFVARKAEPLLCKDFQEEISKKLGVPILGDIVSYEKMLDFVLREDSPFLLDGKYLR